MNKRLPTLLSVLIGTALYSQTSMAVPLAEQCMIGVPTYDKPLIQGSADTLPVEILSDDIYADYPEKAIFSGNVDITQGNRRLAADEAELEQLLQPGQEAPLRTVTATGDVRYDDNQIKVKGPKAWANLNTKDSDIYEGEYQMVGRQGRGKSQKMKMRDENRYTIIEKGDFTSCLPGDNSWSVYGSEVIHDREEQVAEIWNAVFKVGPVPVFYSPYLQLPVGDKRRSGFLIPNAKYSSSDSFEFMLPFYWNIAPNYDATFTPHYISRRGTQLRTEFRYLTLPGSGLIEFDWLPDDDKYSEAYPTDSNSDRWLFYWRHSGVWNKYWRFNADYTKVSDARYFSDLDSEYGSTTDGYASQKFSVGFANDNWDATVSTKQFQVFTSGGNQNAYRTEPQFDANYYKNDLGPFDFRTYAQVVKFTSENPRNPTATRWHIEPTLSLPLANKWSSLNTEVKLMSTHFQQDVPGDFAGRNGQRPEDLGDSINRFLPEVKVNGKMVFDRDMILAQGYTQTLEPQIQYLYIPYKDQSNIYVYDTTLLQSDYSGLFRDRLYSGLDRIASANQVTTGVTTRIYDDSLVERFNASVGQIYYFSRSRTGDNYNSLYQDDTGSRVWAADSYLKLNQQWGMRFGLQYGVQVESVTLGSAVLEYRKDQDRLLQLNYRYASPEYIQAMLPSLTNTLYKEGISQVGAVGSWPIADRWALVGAYYYDTKQNQVADSMIGMQYNTCCWAFSVGYERKITEWDRLTDNSKYDNKWSINLQLRGLSRNYDLGAQDLLRSNILPYQRAF